MDAREFLNERRKRAFAQILGFLEHEVYDHLPADKKDRISDIVRDEVRVALGAYHDVALDVLKVTGSDEGVVQNEVVFDLLRQVHESQIRIARAVEAG